MLRTISASDSGSQQTQFAINSSCKYYVKSSLQVCTAYFDCIEPCHVLGYTLIAVLTDALQIDAVILLQSMHGGMELHCAHIVSSKNT